MLSLSLSIIVPVYRVEDYLNQCVTSLLDQGLKLNTYEIILVDDGSDDNCPAMCDWYAAQYPHVHAIHQKNGGLSAARNTGILASKGQYIAFVDSDDLIPAGTFAKLIEQVQQDDADIAQFGYTLVSGSTYYGTTMPIIDPHQCCDGLTFLDKYLDDHCYVCRNIFLRELIIQHQLWFKEGIQFEDIDWLPRTLICAQKVIGIHLVGYYYRQRIDSISHVTSLEKINRNITSMYSAIDSLVQLAADKPQKRWFNAMISTTICSIYTLVASYCYNQFDQYHKIIVDKFPYKLSSHPNFSWKEHLKIFIINLSPRFYCFLRHFVKL